MKMTYDQAKKYALSVGMMLDLRKVFEERAMAMERYRLFPEDEKFEQSRQRQEELRREQQWRDDYYARHGCYPPDPEDQ